ncbi:hypothetical protein LG299_12250 [Microbacterium lacus]|uniref:hypothetical protein n=1 Tax=Microbacterium lacus TaxID=415217 RepID=UPI00384C047E
MAHSARTSLESAHAAHGDEIPSRRRNPVSVWAIVALSTLVVAVVVAWGAGLRSTYAIGDSVPHNGGVVVVSDAWVMDDPMRLMHPDDPDRFASAGMASMPMTMPDSVPEGFKRIAVELALRSGTEPMQFPVEGVTVTAAGQSYAIYTSMLQDGQLAPGSALDAIAVFEVPAETGAAEFRLAEGFPPVSLNLVGGHDPHED